MLNHTNCDLQFIEFAHKGTTNATIANFNRDSMYVLIGLESLLLLYLIYYLATNKLSQLTRFTITIVTCTFLASVVTIFELSCWLNA